MLRDLIVQKWGKEYDCEFTVTDYLGKSSVYLNVFPWSSDAEPWRHDDETAYLEHLQAVCEQLITWKRVAAVRRQITETDKEPRRGTIYRSRRCRCGWTCPMSSRVQSTRGAVGRGFP